MARLAELLKALPRLQIPHVTLIKPLQTFTCFQSLPVELRNRIWYFVAGQPRNITLYRVSTSRDFDLPLHIEQASIPAILRTSHDARVEGLRYYQAVPENNWGLPSRPVPNHWQPYHTIVPEQRRATYINFDVDTLVYIEIRSNHISSDTSNGVFRFNIDIESLQQTRLLAVKVNSGLFMDPRVSLDDIRELLKLKQVRSFTVVLKSVFNTYGSRMMDCMFGLLYGKAVQMGWASHFKKLMEPSLRNHAEMSFEFLAPKDGFDLDFAPCKPSLDAEF